MANWDSPVLSQATVQTRLHKSICCNRQRPGRQGAGREQAEPGRQHECRWMEEDLILHCASSKAADHCNYSRVSWWWGTWEGWISS